MFNPTSGFNNGDDSRFTHEINVLLVGHDEGCLVTTLLLEAYSYKVTRVGNAMAALSTLLEGKPTFDLVLVDVSLNDFDAFKLLKLIVKMDKLAMLMSDNQDDVILSKALESGACMFVNRPLSVDVIEQMRQLVMRDMIRKSDTYEKAKDIFHAVNNKSGKCDESRAKVAISCNSRIEMSRNKRKGQKGLARKAKRCRKHSTTDQECNSMPESKNNRTGTVRRKVCTQWTEELHEKFMNAVKHLGEGRCFPKEILELMNVPGLTRMQVASHLQRCRNDEWKAPGGQKVSHPPNVQTSSDEDEVSEQQPDPEKCLDQNQSKAQENGINLSFGNDEVSQQQSDLEKCLDQNQSNAQENGINLSFGNDLSGNEGRQDVHHGGPLMRSVSYQLMNNLGGHDLGQHGHDLGQYKGYATDDGAQIANNINTEIGFNGNAIGNYMSTMGNTQHNSGGFVMAPNFISSSMYQEQQEEDEFSKYLREMDEFFPNTILLPEGIVDQSSATPHPVYDFNQIFLDQQPSAANRNIQGHWDADASFYPKS